MYNIVTWRFIWDLTRVEGKTSRVIYKCGGAYITIKSRVMLKSWGSYIRGCWWSISWVVSRDSLNFGYRQSWKHSLQIYREVWGKNTVYRFGALFKDLPFTNTKILPLKYQNIYRLLIQNVTVKIPKYLPFTDSQTPPPPHLDAQIKIQGSYFTNILCRG
jgi:hypothetical protein